MRIKAKDPHLVSLMGEFMRIYLPGVRNRDDDTVASYRYSINLFVAYLESENNVTVLFVSHSLAQVQRICNKAMILDHGELVAFGNIDDVAKQYQLMIN